MDIRKLQRAIVDALEDVKAQDIVVFNTEELSALFERVIVASGTSNRQTKALAASVRDKVREVGGDLLSMEGEDNGEWIIVDCGQAVVHIMQPGIRQYYHLEELWGDKPVRLKLANEKKSLVKASEGEMTKVRVKPVSASQSPEDEPITRKKAPARKAAAKKAAPAIKTTAAPATRSRSTRKDPEAQEQAKVEARRKAKATAVEAGEKAAARSGTAASRGAAVPAAKVPAAKKAARKSVARPVEEKLVVKPAVRRTAPAAGKTAAKRPARKTTRPA